MSKKRKDALESAFSIPEQFFKENPISEMCTGTLLMFEMDILFNKDLRAEMEKAVKQVSSEGRFCEIRADAALTEAADTPEKIIERMRKGDISNREAVCAKALNMEDDIMPEVIRLLKRSSYDNFIDIMPEVIRLLKRSSYDNFIETATLTLSRAKECYIDRIIAEFDEIRSPYAMCSCCILLAFRNRFDALPIIMKAYQSLKKRKEESDRRCSEGALYAIYSLTRHFS